MSQTKVYAEAALAGAVIRRLRKQRQWSTTTLAQAAGCSHQLVSAIELGQVDINYGTLARLARALGVTVSTITVAAEEATALALLES